MTPHYVNQGGELNWLLDDLVTRVPQVSKAVMLTQDGLPIAASASLNREDAEHLAALASGFQSMARGAGQHFGGGRVRQTIIEMEAAFLFVSAAGQGTCLAVLSTGDADVGLVAYEMAVLVRRSSEHLGFAPRPSGYPRDYPAYAQEQPQQRPPAMAGSAGMAPPFPAQPHTGTQHGGPPHRGPAAPGTASPYPPGGRMSPPSIGTASAPLAQRTPQPRGAASPDSVYSPYSMPAAPPVGSVHGVSRPMPSPEERWLDSEAGPVVRPYALIGGRTRHAGEKFDLVATVKATRRQVSDPAALSPEQVWALNLARRPTTVADLASELNLPLGVVRILLADLRDAGFIVIRSPVTGHSHRDSHILREVLNGLRAL